MYRVSVLPSPPGIYFLPYHPPYRPLVCKNSSMDFMLCQWPERFYLPSRRTNISAIWRSVLLSSSDINAITFCIYTQSSSSSSAIRKISYPLPAFFFSPAILPILICLLACPLACLLACPLACLLQSSPESLTHINPSILIQILLFLYPKFGSICQHSNHIVRIFP